MVKTTLYLPGDLKRRVGQLAERRGVSEAEFIRAALSHEVAAEQPLSSPRRSASAVAISEAVIGTATARSTGKAPSGAS